MITFRQFLTEARMAPLYHATSVTALTQILKLNTIKRSVGDYLSVVPSVSLTRNLNFAKYWARENFGINDSAILELNQDKLSRNYKISPFNFWNDEATRAPGTDDNIDKNEFEERVVNRDIVNLDRYLEKIIFVYKPVKPIGDPVVDVILKHPKLYYAGKFVNK